MDNFWYYFFSLFLSYFYRSLRRIFVILKSPGQFVELRARADERGTAVFIDAARITFGRLDDDNLDMGTPQSVVSMVFRAGSLNGPTLDTFSLFLVLGLFPPTAMMKDYATCSIKYPEGNHITNVWLRFFCSVLCQEHRHVDIKG